MAIDREQVKSNMYIKSIEIKSYDDMIYEYCKLIDNNTAVELETYKEVCVYFVHAKQYEKVYSYSNLGLQSAGWSDEYQYTGHAPDNLIADLLFYHGIACQQNSDHYEEALHYFYASWDCM